MKKDFICGVDGCACDGICRQKKPVRVVNGKNEPACSEVIDPSKPKPKQYNDR